MKGPTIGHAHAAARPSHIFFCIHNRFTQRRFWPSPTTQPIQTQKYKTSMIDHNLLDRLTGVISIPSYGRLSAELVVSKQRIPAMTPPIVEFQHVNKTYRLGLFRRRTIHALRDVSFRSQRLRIRPAGPEPRGQDDACEVAALDLPPDLRARSSAWAATIADRSTLAQVGYLHESPAFPRYLTARAFLDYYGALCADDAGGSWRRGFHSCWMKLA